MSNLIDLAAGLLDAARAAENGRSAKLVVHDGALRQSVIALVAGTELGEHASPPAASLYVMQGRVRVTGFEEPVLSAGTISVLTHQRHAVLALEDSVFLLTTVTGVPTATTDAG